MKLPRHHENLSRTSCFYPKADLAASDQYLRSLATLDAAPLARQAAAAYVRQFAIEPSAVVPLEQQGTFHRLFRVSSQAGPNVIARLCILDRAEHENLLHLDRWIYKRLNAASLPALRVFAVEPSGGAGTHARQLLEEASGHPLSRYDGDEQRTGRLLAELGRLLARLHAIGARGFGLLDASTLAVDEHGAPRGAWNSWPDYLRTNFVSHLHRTSDLGAIDAAETLRVRDAFNAAIAQLGDIQPVLLHGDLGSHNVYTDGITITALVDWEDCLSGDAVFDLAFWATFHPRRRHRALLSAYRAACDLPADFELRFWLYFLRVALAKTVLRDRFGLRDRPGRSPASGRIRLALERLEACLESGQTARSLGRLAALA
ncbi:MAG TPA: aminoglycoside phosphotransferase family protein [Pirellulales bacterium]